MTHPRPLTLIALPLAAVASASHAADYEITLTNLTSGMYVTPPIVAAHPASASVFATGEPASEELRAVAEGGDTAALAALLESVGASIEVAEDLLGPGESVTFTLSTADAPSNDRLSLAGMLLPTNDGFVGLDSLPLPASPPPDPIATGTDGSGDVAEAPPPLPPGGPDDADSPEPLAGEAPDPNAPVPPADAPLDPFGAPDDADASSTSVAGADPDGAAPEPIEPVDVDAPDPDLPDPGVPAVDQAATPTLTVDLLGYDAGTEANDEIVGGGALGEPGFPLPPLVAESGVGAGATGIEAPIEGFVNVHRGVRGDDDPTGGASDVAAAVHGWLNPVARLTVTVIDGS